MALIVQKYGGTSVGDVERILNVARRVKETYDAGNQVVVVVSARSGVTNELIARAKSISSKPDNREMDMLLCVGEQETIALLAMALQSLGVPAVSRTGAQAGMLTDKSHTKARITGVTGGDIPDRLAEGKVVVVAGFQGQTSDGEMTTLGRGGSDLSAIAIAYALRAQICQIYTDVDGVYTADPRVVKTAKKLKEMSYDQMLELASSGSKVMQARAVEFAQKFNVPFEVRSSFNNNPGTIVKKKISSMEDFVVSGVAIDNNESKITLRGLPDDSVTVAKIFQALAEDRIIVDLIIQNVGHDGLVNLTFSVNTDDVARAEEVVNKCLSQLGIKSTAQNAGKIAVVALVGVGMISNSGIAAKFFKALSEKNIKMQMIATSEIRLSAAVDPSQANAAAEAIHEAFELGKDI